MSLEMFLNWAALAVSFFNAISLLWLGLMVFLGGSRKSVGTLLAGGGLRQRWWNSPSR